MTPPAVKQNVTVRVALALFCALMMPLMCRSQVVISNSSGGRLIISSGGTVQLNSRTMPSGQTTPNEFDQMVASAASFDMDSPVEAHAEFDPPEAPVGGRVVYRIEVSALDESLSVPDTLPAPKGLDLHVGGRGQTYERSGAMKLRPITTVIYRATVTNIGTFTIPSFNLTAYGKPVKVPEATLTVVPKGAAAAWEAPRLLMLLPPGDIYVGQLLRVKLALPTQENGGIMGLSQPHISGDFIFSEQFSMGMRQEPVDFDGKVVPAFAQEVMVTPLRAGKEELIGQTHGNIFRQNPAQPGAYSISTTLVDSDPVELDVKPLPEAGVLPGFTGAVGQFQIGPARLSATEVRVGEPVTLTLIVRGDGNLGRMTPPMLPKLTDWQGFPPEPTTLSPASIQLRGFASFDYTLIPLSPKITATPAIPFSYFDPVKKKYVDLTFPLMPITVTPGPTGVAAQAPPPDAATPNNDQDDPTTREKEPMLSGLATKPGMVASALVPMQQRAWFWALQIMPAIALGALWAWDRRRRYLEQYPQVILKRRARRGLRRQLRLARNAAQARDAAGFVTAGASAFRHVCSAQNAANPDALVCADVLLELPDAERSGRRGEMIRRFFAAADALRFGGAIKESPELFALQSDLEQTLEQMKERLC
jgi:hypothetical protein